MSEQLKLIENKHMKSQSDYYDLMGVLEDKDNEIKELVCILGISKSGISYDKDTIYPCHIVLLSLSPENKPDIHRKFISKFQLLLSNAQLKDNIINFISLENVEKILSNWEIQQKEESL